MDEVILSYTPQRIREVLKRLPVSVVNHVEEIRVRIGRPIELVVQNESLFLTWKGTLTLQEQEGLVATHEDGHKMMNLISRHSVYAIEEELRRGYITIKGGHRVGITGRAVVENNKVKLLKDIKSFNIRVSREMKGIAYQLFPALLKNQRFQNTLIISPPRCGKTTLLRDMIRLLSYGVQELQLRGQKVGVVDERSEIASCLEGVPQNDLGPRVDVLDACPKAEGMMMLIRSMSPDVIATDEIGGIEDTQAILEAIYAGVTIITTAHGDSLEEIRKRPNLSALFEQNVFQRYILLSKRKGVGTIEAILDQREQEWSPKKGAIIHA